MQKNTKTAGSKGFTLMEILVVMGIIAILAAIVIVAINPARQFAQARNSQRQSNINTILNAIGQNLADNKGAFTCSSGTIPVSDTTGTVIGTDSGLVNLTCLETVYIPTKLPTDPDKGSAGNTGYTVRVDNLGRYTVCAPKASETALGNNNPGEICVTR